MPLYTYKCPACGGEPIEIISKYDDRDAQVCETCGGILKREGVEKLNIGKPGHQMGVVLGDGSKVKGNFQKSRGR